MKHQHIAAALTLPLAVGLAGCAGASGTGGGEQAGPVTVTVRPTVTAPPAEPGTSSSSSSGSTRPNLKSDVAGRDFDFGTVTRVRTEKGVDVLTLDRWTWKGLDDAKLATNGVPVKPFRGTPYENQNDKLTYDIPVAENARILHHHCIATDQPLQTKSVPAPELAHLAGHENLVLVKLDGEGHLVAADNLPGCSG